ncbi:NADH:flavin oxidoreductase/NADH oxidase [Daedaleopsis nitida]|nr:NADH:flavin oxidoreductase/NADH oxidase [Daedaleopsis nitida]
MSATTTSPALFQPTQLGNMKLAHRVVLAPLTRLRADAEHVPTELLVEYYKQRSSVPGTLLITEATIIAPKAGGMPHAPGIWSDAQIAAWKKVVDVVHTNKSYIYLQLWAMGRAARPVVLKKKDPSLEHVAPSAIPLSDRPNDVPRPLTIEEIKEYTKWFGAAAHNAVHRAGFDGIELHGANGYLIDQFLQDVSNQRTDEYGGSIENRARFPLDVLQAVVDAVGQERSAIRLSPWSTYQDMRMEDPIPTFSYLVQQIKARFPNLAYLHHTGPNVQGTGRGPEDESQTDFIQKLWAPLPAITNGGFTRESGLKTAEETGQLVAYGSLFLANPDLPFRLRENVPFNKPDPTSFYTPLDPVGYTTYTFSDAFLQTRA